WDMQVGSDGITACASCHFHAGADNRVKNQLSPGLLRVNPDGTPNPDKTFQVGGPNYTLQLKDFPFHKLKNINDPNSTVISDRNDVASSQGVLLEQFMGLDTNYNEIRFPLIDDVFRVGTLTTRRVEPRNTPTAINAIFNKRNFWDGRAQDFFNGVNPFGLRDANARVFYAPKPGQVSPVAVAIDNASLASQAVGPPLSAFEMSAADKLFPELGRRLLRQRPLARQLVHAQDSVLGALSLGAAPGLATTNYAELIRQAFRREWWHGTVEGTISTAAGTAGGTADADSSLSLAKAMPLNKQTRVKPTTFTQMEANFSLFFGLAIQLYEATLVSDQTPFDAFAEGNTAALTANQQRGLALFQTKGQCVVCHIGPEFTAASVQHVNLGALERMLMGNGLSAVYDVGFYNIGVRPTLEDLGLGGMDPFGFPLSESRLLSLFGPAVFERVIGAAPNLTLTAGERVAANGAFKTPGLRNVELTAPYFHNGGQRTLREVVDFYNRGGDFGAQNIADLDADIGLLALTNAEKDALVDFLKALTDERVRFRRAPFDHPQLLIPNGHVGDTVSVVDDGFGRATDAFLELPATGRNGGTPFRSFLE
ncbi:MAG: cytochrome-c peroxidase, partial [Verrucomicrobiota bacterium]